MAECMESFPPPRGGIGAGPPGGLVVNKPGLRGLFFGRIAVMAHSGCGSILARSPGGFLVAASLGGPDHLNPVCYFTYFLDSRNHPDGSNSGGDVAQAHPSLVCRKL